MFNEYIFLFIIMVQMGLIVYQHIHWSKLTNKLVDKLMSRNYAEYQQAEALGFPQVKIDKEHELPEDLRTLQDFKLI